MPEGWFLSHEGRQKGVDFERVLAAVERAFGFIETQGDSLDRLRFQVLLEREEPESLLRFLRRDDWDRVQGSENRTEHWEGADLVSSLEILTMLDDHGLLQSDRVRELVCRLAERAKVDGTWTDPQEVGEDRYLFLTGMLTSFFVKSSCISISVTDSGLETMMRAWSQERANALSWDLLAAYSHLLTHQTHDRGDEALSWCGRELSKGLRGGVLSALHVVRILLFCDAFALPGLPEEGGDLITRLLCEQLPDGSFAASPEFLGLRTPSQATLCAVSALSRFSREMAGGRLRSQG